MIIWHYVSVNFNIFDFFLYTNMCFFSSKCREFTGIEAAMNFITRYGIYSAVAKYLKLKEYVAGIFESDYKCIKEYFRSDSDGVERFENVIDIIVKSNNNVQRDRAGEAKISFNGEQIREGHNILVYLRGLIEKKSKAEYPNIAGIQEIIGQYLYTLQAFYSNTNCIEINGVKPYVDLGIKNAQIVDIASPSENTCKNSYRDQKHLGHCPDNIIEVNKLTSGYKNGQEVTKPQSTSFDKGKCSHGGPNDSTRSTTANCGINKETSDSVLSPHYDLHEHAAAAAIMATEHFISGNGTGLINTFKESLFEKVFGLTKWSAKSLAYAIKVSGSMSNDIAIVKSKTKDIIFTLQNGPVDYV
ncbi:hypothetical protein KUTeg_015731 [Tegillarca granosa]|uniref:VWA7 N-terminal domain-containing protein n=1 Tax=Tegillarca granosa TaxID=220873 RepID=A0ABQ9ETG5_TEGGR|nr:hypothetical protein KUTeg_015731 [Tegillarca granosa]